MITRTRNVLEIIMASNAALFFFGAIQHAGVALGPFHEPRIVPASIVETLCGLSLLVGVTTIFRRSLASRRAAVVSNLVALGGVLLGIAALAVGAGPRTASNDIYHSVMLALIAAGLLILFTGTSGANAEKLREAKE